MFAAIDFAFWAKSLIVDSKPDMVAKPAYPLQTQVGSDDPIPSCLSEIFTELS